MLSLLINKLSFQRKSRLLITVEDDNTPSIRVVEKNGGILKDTTVSHRTKKKLEDIIFRSHRKIIYVLISHLKGGV